MLQTAVKFPCLGICSDVRVEDCLDRRLGDCVSGIERRLDDEMEVGASDEGDGGLGNDEEGEGEVEGCEGREEHS